MNWFQLLFDLLVALWVGLAFYVWRLNRLNRALFAQLIRDYHSLTVENVRMGGVCRALTLRLNPNGHVDLSLEEVAENGRVQMFKEEDHVRVLVK